MLYPRINAGIELYPVGVLTSCLQREGQGAAPDQPALVLQEQFLMASVAMLEQLYPKCQLEADLRGLLSHSTAKGRAAMVGQPL